MVQIRKHYSPTFKAQVVQEVLAGEKSLGQIAAQYGIHPKGTSLSYYNQQRPHQSLGYQTPAEVYFGETGGVHAD
jgi:transposase-like protein